MSAALPAAKRGAWSHRPANKTPRWKALLVCTMAAMSAIVLLVFSAQTPASEMRGTRLEEDKVGASPPQSGRDIVLIAASSSSSTSRSPDVAPSSTSRSPDVVPSSSRSPDVAPSSTTHSTTKDQSSTTRRPESLTRHSKNRGCPTGGVVTVEEAGRLGNKMWQYATTWATALDTGLDPYVPRSLRRALDKVFRDLSVPPMDVISHCRVDWRDTVKSPYNWKHNSTQNIVLPTYPFYEEVALRRLDELRREFSFREDLVATSRRVLGDVGRSANVSGGEVTFVGVHVRRTDYSHHLWVRGKAVLAEVSFFLDAMEYFRGKYGGGVVFVVASDEPEWCRQKLAAGRRDVFVVGGAGQSTPEQDLAVLSSCNHSIIDYGTFGSWAAIFANGETVVFNLSIAEETSMIALKHFHNWKAIG